MSAAWIGATWAGWMHSFAPKPCRRDQARSASRRASSPSWGVTPPTGVGRSRAAGGDGQPACGVGQPVRRVVELEVEVERVVERAEDQAATTPAAAAISSAAATPRALSTSASTAHAGAADAHGRDVVGRLGLGQHDRRSARRRPRRRGRRAAWGEREVVGAHDDAGPLARVRRRRPRPGRPRGRRPWRRRRPRPRGRARRRRPRWPAPCRTGRAGCPGRTGRSGGPAVGHVRPPPTSCSARDLGGVVAQLGEEGVGVLAEGRHGVHPHVGPAARRQQRRHRSGRRPDLAPAVAGLAAAGAPTPRASC